MELKELLELSGVILGSLGGGVAIIFGFSSWLGKVWANRLMTKEKAEYAQELESLRNRLTQDTESYKIKLKKSELLFEKQFEAASNLVALIRSYMPRYSFPHMDWEDVCDHLVRISESIETDLDKYLSMHGAVLGTDVVDQISLCIGMSGEIKFEDRNPDISSNSLSEASKLYDELKKAEELIINKVHSQTST